MRLQPPMNADERRYDDLTEQVIGCAYRVANTLGVGFLEKVYENALVIELRQAGLAVQQQLALPVRYQGQLVGEYVADLLVAREVLVELKAVKALDEVHQAQCLNYLKAADLHVCLLLNFGTPRIQVKRIVLNL
jgi:GxxExxY protein